MVIKPEDLKKGELAQLLGLQVIEVEDKFYLINPEALSFSYPVKDIEVKEEKKEKEIGWTMTETVGIGIVNPRATTAVTGGGGGSGKSSFVPERERLTEEEKLERKFLNKGW